MFSIMKLHKYATESELIQTNRAKTNLKTLYKAIKIGFSEFKESFLSSPLFRKKNDSTMMFKNPQNKPNDANTINIDLVAST